MNIYLIGFMGCGKTTYGKQLANELDFNFLDIDEKIENIFKKSINELFESGENHFRKIERDYLLTTASVNNYVVSTGGGTACFFDNMEWMNKNGITIYLKLNDKILQANLRMKKEQRPLLKDINDNELLSLIQNTLEQRERFYSKANIIINPNNINPNRLTNTIKIHLDNKDIKT